jgi:hypothetical protein
MNYEKHGMIMTTMLIFMICIICLTYLICTNNFSEYDAKTNNIDQKNKNIIIIDEQTYYQMLDAITHYSLLTNKYNEKLTLIYLSTFHLFDMNYAYDDVKILDASLIEYPYFPIEMNFPTGNMHNNLQKAIITHINKNIDSSDRKLSDDKINDREILDIYLKDLFKGIGVVKNKD